MLTEYETKRLILKILTPDKCNSVLRFYKDNCALFEKYNPIMPKNYYTTDYQRNTLSAEYKSFLSGKSIRYYIYEKSNTKRIIGTISLNDIKKAFSSSAVIGYRFGSEYHHNGYATESLEKLILALFKEEHIHRIEAYIQPDNIPSKKLIERLGFQYEGICYSHTMVAQHWEDMERYSIISTDINQ